VRRGAQLVHIGKPIVCYQSKTRAFYDDVSFRDVLDRIKVNFYNKDQYYNDTIKPRTLYKTIVFPFGTKVKLL